MAAAAPAPDYCVTIAARRLGQSDCSAAPDCAFTAFVLPTPSKLGGRERLPGAVGVHGVVSAGRSRRRMRA